MVAGSNDTSRRGGLATACPCSSLAALPGPLLPFRLGNSIERRNSTTVILGSVPGMPVVRLLTTATYLFTSNGEGLATWMAALKDGRRCLNLDGDMGGSVADLNPGESVQATRSSLILLSTGDGEMERRSARRTMVAPGPPHLIGCSGCCRLSMPPSRACRTHLLE